jgi:glycosyltransferase involved in cell wall biosynthesis
MARARRILMVSGPAAGGLQRHLQALAAGLPAWSLEIAVAAPAAVNMGECAARYWLDLGDRPRPLSDLGTLRVLGRVVRQWRPDLVHAHGVKAALLSLGGLPSGRPPVVATFHNLWHGGPLTLPLRLLIRRAAAGVAVSEAVRSRLAAWGIRPRNLEVIPNGLDIRAFSPVPAPPPGRPFTAAFLGRLTEEKGVPILLAAARHLASELSPSDYPSTRIRVVVAGDGPLRAVVESEAKREGAVLQYLGYREDVLAIYYAADVVLMPSLAEGHPMTALEAMACGLPVVASHVGGLPEIVVEGETGLLVRPGDAAALAEAITRLAADPGRARALGTAGRQRVEREFTVDRMLERLVAVYEKVLS